VKYVPFNKPPITGHEFSHVEEAIRNAHLSGNGPFSKRCNSWLEDVIGTKRALLTSSCTAALEMSALLLELEPGDEVIMPSFTFVSTAAAVALRRAVPVFVDVREDTLNLDESRLEAAFTARTRAVVVVHYAGVACEMNPIVELAEARGIAVVEDAAQGINATYRGRPLGSIGCLAALSFHETKNVTCGEGGAILVNDERFIERAEIIYEKGTNRAQFFSGQVDKYTWVDLGSSFPLSDLNAAFLWAQLQESETLTRKRLSVWKRYHQAFEELEARGVVRRPIVPDHCTHNAHLYYLLLNSGEARTTFIEHAEALGVNAVFHYMPLHLSEAGRRFGRPSGSLDVTTSVAERLVRLPLWVDMQPDDVEHVVSVVHALLAEPVT
jgi:dTDP-4-amino-4,6-dideoxygalactose transaminase